MKNRTFLFIAVCLLTGFVLTSCSGGGGGGADCKNIAGTWIATQTINGNSCSTTIDTCKAYVIAQDGCNITVSDSTGTYSGTVNNNNEATWSGSFQDNGTNMVISADIVFPDDPYDGLRGTVHLNSANGSCSGSAYLEAMYKPATTVIATSPSNGAQNVPIDSSITASFSGNVTFTPYGTFTVSANGNQVDGAVVGSTNTNVATFAPSGYLEYNTTYTVTLSKNLNCGTWATPMLNDYTWNFSTGAAPVDDFWTPTAATAAPAPRKAHSAVWTGSKMIVWGGQDDNGNSMNTGGVYDPMTDLWTATSVTNAPTALTEHTAVWTGSKMIVWGGSGGIYDPTTDIWSAMSATNTPAAIENYSAVWTGSEMIVWGISGYPFPEPDGAKYDPLADLWTMISTTNAPSASYFHQPTTVWAGSTMIVWGGDLSSNAGGKYDSQTDTWTATSTLNAPSARYGHTAISTGSKMIVWGGSTGSQFVNTGAIYDPSSDVWSAISTINAPSARYLHSAVWTGSKMIVWGGRDLTQEFNTGGVYDPVSDTWSPLSVIYAPSAREGHSAVWTGSNMIIWGGDVGDGSTNVTDTGGRYTP